MNKRTFTSGIHYVSPTDFLLEVDSSAGGVVLILPAISTYNDVKNRIGSLNQTFNYRFQDVAKTAGTNNIIFQSNPDDDINNASNVVISTDGANGTIIITGDNEWSLDAGSTGGSGSADVLTVALKPTQIFSLVMADPDDWDGVPLDLTDASMVNANGRSMTATFGIVNNTLGTLTATLWNVTDGIAVAGVPTTPIPISASETTVSMTANPSSANIGKQLGVRITGIAGGTYQILSGGLGIADMIANFLPAPSTLYPILIGNANPSNGLDYVSKSSVGILKGLSTHVFSASVVSFHQGIPAFQETTDNFGGLTLTQANADVPPTLATATTIKSDIGIKMNSFAFAPSLVAGRMVFLFSNEQYVAGL